jgi:two-component system, sensor histidine kinase PdtaS
MFRRWLTFGLSEEQEDRFRQANFGADIAQARVCILLLMAVMVLFAVNDYAFFGLSPCAAT